MKIQLALFSIVSLLSFGSVQAGEEGKGACARDVQTFCSNVGRGEGRIARCLREHQSSLSDACRTKIGERRAEMKKEMKEVRAACEVDAAHYCGDVRSGQGRKLSCLKANKDKLSNSCRAELEDHKRFKGKN